MAHLRLGLSVAVVFYLPHLIAQRLGAFRDEGVTVEFVTSYGQQWALLQSGAVDVAIGGRTLANSLDADSGSRNVIFCGALRANPWFVIGRPATRPFEWNDLVGKTLLGLPDFPQAICLRWILLQHGIDAQQVTVRSCGDMDAELRAFRAGEGDYLLHSLHSAAPMIAAGEAMLLQELATPTGFVPWSIYAARLDVMRKRRAEFEAFTRAIAKALRWIATSPAEAVAALLAPYYPEWTHASLTGLIATYQPLGIWPADPLIPRAEWEHYNAIYQATGLEKLSVRYDDYVDSSLAEQANASMGNGTS